MIIVGTSGHIDHGKTTLVMKLTGIDTDRLKEEKQRGISIELGFAYIDLPGGRRLGLIDVPGHERFVHHMIAGATGVDLVVLVVAADEGMMPQTREHVSICQLLGMRAGVVVLTKTDLVDPEWLLLVKDDVRSFLSSTFLANAPVLEFSSTWQDARLEAFREELYTTLDRLTSSVAKISAERPFMLPVDRVFSIKGFGTVVTGTVQSGAVAAGDPVVVLPSGRPGRVRRIEVHGQPAERSEAGTRTAVNLPDVETGDVNRGDVLAAPGGLRPLTVLTATLETVDSLSPPLKGQFKALFHTGSAMAEASVRVLDRNQMGPSEKATVVVRLQAPLAVLPGNRHILRGFTPMAGYGKTLGGGTILWPGPVKPRGRAMEMLGRLEGTDPAGLLEAAAFLSGANGLPAVTLPSLLPVSARQIATLAESPGPAVRTLAVGGARRYVHVDELASVRSLIVGLLDAYHAANPRKKGMLKEELKTRLPAFIERDVVQAYTDELVREGTLSCDETTVSRAGFSVNLDDGFVRLSQGVATALRSGGSSPPDKSALVAQLRCSDKQLMEALTHLVSEGTAVRIASDLYFHREAVESCRQALLRHFATHAVVTTQELKEIWGLSRKYLIPLAEYFDAARVTYRVGNAERKLRGS